MEWECWIQYALLLLCWISSHLLCDEGHTGCGLGSGASGRGRLSERWSVTVFTYLKLLPTTPFSQPFPVEVEALRSMDEALLAQLAPSGCFHFAKAGLWANVSPIAWLAHLVSRCSSITSSFWHCGKCGRVKLPSGIAASCRSPVSRRPRFAGGIAELKDGDSRMPRLDVRLVRQIKFCISSLTPFGSSCGQEVLQYIRRKVSLSPSEQGCTKGSRDVSCLVRWRDSSTVSLRRAVACHWPAL